MLWVSLEEDSGDIWLLIRDSDGKAAWGRAAGAAEPAGTGACSPASYSPFLPALPVTHRGLSSAPKGMGSANARLGSCHSSWEPYSSPLVRQAALE